MGFEKFEQEPEYLGDLLELEGEYTAYRVDAKFIIISLLDYIDAIPKDIELPTMPGFDRDFVNDFLSKR